MSLKFFTGLQDFLGLHEPTVQSRTPLSSTTLARMDDGTNTFDSVDTTGREKSASVDFVDGKKQAGNFYSVFFFFLCTGSYSFTVMHFSDNYYSS